MPTLRLPTDNGTLAAYHTRPPRAFPDRRNRPFNRVEKTRAGASQQKRSNCEHLILPKPRLREYLSRGSVATGVARAPVWSCRHRAG